MAQTAYEILGVAEHATDDEIRRAWRKHAFDLHPDRLGHVSERVRAVCEDKFKQISEAYELLDDENRFLYDSMLREARASQASPPPNRSPPPPPREPPAWTATEPRTSATAQHGRSRSFQWVFVIAAALAVLLVLSVIARSKGSVWTAAATPPQRNDESSKANREKGAMKERRVRVGNAALDDIYHAAPHYKAPAELVRAEDRRKVKALRKFDERRAFNRIESTTTRSVPLT